MRRTVRVTALGLATLSLAASSTGSHAASATMPSSMAVAGAAQSGESGRAADAGSAGTAPSLVSAGAGAAAPPLVSAGAGAVAAGRGAAGSPPSAAGAGAPAADGGAPAGAAGSSGMSGASGTTSGDAFALSPVGTTMLSAGEFAFPANALPPSNLSPEFTWSSVPNDTKSLALVFRDLTAGAVKWILWDIPTSVTGVPAGIPSQAHPSEPAGTSQLGSLGNQGYAGPCCANNQYEFVLWALDVDKLPVTAGQTTAQIRQTLLPAHQLATTKPVIMRIMP